MRDDEASRVIVLGIAPGVVNLAYCVLHYKEGIGWLPMARAAELLKGIRLNGATLPTDFVRKAQQHAKILRVVLERFPPVLIAVGPPARPKEPELRIEAARLVLRLLVSELNQMGVPLRHMEWRTKEEIATVLGLDKWRSVLDGRIGNQGRLKKPAVRLAAATALAGGTQLLAENHK